MRNSEFRRKIEYLSGKENTYADLQSRIPNELKQESVNIKQVNSRRLRDGPNFEEADMEMEKDKSQGYQEPLAGKFQGDDEFQTITETLCCVLVSERL